MARDTWHHPVTHESKLVLLLTPRITPIQYMYVNDLQRYLPLSTFRWTSAFKIMAFWNMHSLSRFAWSRRKWLRRRYTGRPVPVNGPFHHPETRPQAPHGLSEAPNGRVWQRVREDDQVYSHQCKIEWLMWIMFPCVSVALARVLSPVF